MNQIQIQDDDYEFKYPYDEQCKLINSNIFSIIEASLKHRLATRIWRAITSQSDKYDVCKCCNRKVGEQHMKKNCMKKSTDYSFLGPGIPLYLKFHKYSIFFMLLFIVIFCVYSVVSNILINDCNDDNSCVVTIWNILSIINKKNNSQYMLIQNYVLLAFVVVSLLVLHVFRYRLRSLQQKIDETQVSASDYSIILKRLPENVDENMIHEAIQNKIKTFGEAEKKEIKIQKIILSYDLRDYVKHKKEMMKKFKEAVEKGQVSAENEEKQIEFEKQEMKRELHQKAKKTGLFAIVVFERQSSKEYFIYKPNFWRRFLSYLFTAWTPASDLQIKGKKVSIQRAPQPDDIIWQNAYFTPSKRFARKCYLNLISLIILVAGGAIQYGIDVYQTKATSIKQFFEIGILGSVVAIIVDIIIEKFLHHFTQFQKMYTQTQFLDTMTFKSCVQQFLNAGIFVLFANVLANLNNNIFQYSLPGTITQITILSAIVPNLITFFTKLCECKGAIKRSLCLKKHLKFYTQLQANRIYELPKPQFPKKYSYVLKTLWLTAFYAPLVPIVVPIATIGLFINYLMQKFFFSFKYSVSHKIGAALNYSCVQGLEYIPFILSLGQFLVFIYLDKIYGVYTPGSWYTIIYVCLGISFLNIILPMKEFNQYIEKKLCCKKGGSEGERANGNLEDLTYQQARKKFQITYEMTNPLYQVKRIKRRDDFIESYVGNFLRNFLPAKKEYESKGKQQQTQREEGNDSVRVGLIENLMRLGKENETTKNNNKVQEKNKSQLTQKINQPRRSTQIQFSVMKSLNQNFKPTTFQQQQQSQQNPNLNSLQNPNKQSQPPNNAQQQNNSILLGLLNKKQ